MTEETNHVKLVQKKEGIYTIYVFQKDDNSYIMCTKLPNWGIYSINIGDSGFLTTNYLEAGESYYNRRFETFETIKFNNNYFKEFIKDTKKIKEIIL